MEALRGPSAPPTRSSPLFPQFFFSFVVLQKSLCVIHLHSQKDAFLIRLVGEIKVEKGGPSHWPCISLHYLLFNAFFFYFLNIFFSPPPGAPCSSLCVSILFPSHASSSHCSSLLVLSLFFCIGFFPVFGYSCFSAPILVSSRFNTFSYILHLTPQVSSPSPFFPSFFASMSSLTYHLRSAKNVPPRAALLRNQGYQHVKQYH